MLTGEVGAGKTVCVRAALASLDPSRYRPIYIPNPGIGTRGIHQRITMACGQAPRFHTGSLLPQAAAALATEAAKHGRTPILIVDEAHQLDHQQLESLRMLTLCRDRDYAGGRQECPGDRVGTCVERAA